MGTGAAWSRRASRVGGGLVALFALFAEPACGSGYGSDPAVLSPLSPEGGPERPDAGAKLGSSCLTNDECADELVCESNACVQPDAGLILIDGSDDVDSGPPCEPPKKDVGVSCDAHQECCSTQCNSKHVCVAAQCVTLSFECGTSDDCCVGLWCAKAIKGKCVKCIPQGSPAEKTILGVPLVESCCSRSITLQGDCR